MANFGKQNSKITWASDASVARKRAAKNNPMDNVVRMIDPAGFVVQVSLATGRGIPSVRNLYGPQILAQKEAAGFVKYDSLPEKAREKLIAERKAAHAEKQEAYASQHMTEGQAMAAAVREMAKLAQDNGKG